jgi:hypothetical protein
MDGDRRRGERYRVRIAASLNEGGGHCEDVVVTSLSAEGCRFSVSREMPAGTRVTLEIARAGALAAEVLWRVEKQHGVRFVEPLHRHLIDHARLFLSKPPAFVAEGSEASIAA